jgi:hypothetical protein
MKMLILVCVYLMMAGALHIEVRPLVSEFWAAGDALLLTG